MENKKGFTVTVYLNDGRTYAYNVPGGDASKAVEHANAIAMSGYMHYNEEDGFELYPPHIIKKVKVTGIKVATKYPDVPGAV